MGDAEELIKRWLSNPARGLVQVGAGRKPATRRIATVECDEIGDDEVSAFFVLLATEGEDHRPMDGAPIHASGWHETLSECFDALAPCVRADLEAEKKNGG